MSPSRNNRKLTCLSLRMSPSLPMSWPLVYQNMTMPNPFNQPVSQSTITVASTTFPYLEKKAHIESAVECGANLPTIYHALHRCSSCRITHLGSTYGGQGRSETYCSWCLNEWYMDGLSIEEVYYHWPILQTDLCFGHKKYLTQFLLSHSNSFTFVLYAFQIIYSRCFYSSRLHEKQIEYWPFCHTGWGVNTQLVTSLLWTGLDCAFASYDYGPSWSLVMDLLSDGGISCVRYWLIPRIVVLGLRHTLG